VTKRIKELILKKSLTDLDFGRDVLAKLPSSIFDESVELQSVYTVLKRQLISSSTPPTQESLAIKVEKLLSRQKSSEQDITDSIYFLDSLYNVESDKSLSDESVSTEMENYIKAELTKDAIMQSVRNNELEDVEKIGELGEKITKIAVQNLNGQSGTFIDFFKDIEKKKELLENINKYKFPTGYTRLDNAIEGGLSRGELGTISGLTGGGKSLMVTNLIRNYVHRGLNVLLVSLEEKEERIILRSEQQMMGIPKSKILNSDYSLNEKSFDLLQEIYTKKKGEFGKFWISKHMPQEISPSKLEQIIVNTKVREGENIDVVVIDYPELMINPYRNESESEAGSLIYEFIRKLAQEHRFMCWTLSQVNRNANSFELITKNHIEGSKRKLNSVEIHITINQKEEEFENGFLRLYLDKLRNGSEKRFSKVIPMKVIPETMTIRDVTEEEERQHSSIIEEDSQVLKNKNSKAPNPVERAQMFNQNLGK